MSIKALAHIALGTAVAAFSWSSTAPRPGAGADELKLVVLAHTRDLTPAEKDLVGMKSLPDAKAAAEALGAMTWFENGFLLVADGDSLGTGRAKATEEALEAVSACLTKGKETISFDSLSGGARSAVLGALGAIAPKDVDMAGSNVGIVPTLTLTLKNGDREVRAFIEPRRAEDAAKNLMRPIKAGADPASSPKAVAPDTAVRFGWRPTALGSGEVFDAVSALAGHIADERRKAEKRLDQLTAAVLQQLFGRYADCMGGEELAEGVTVASLPAETTALIEGDLNSMASQWGFRSSDEVRDFVSGARVAKSLRTVSLVIGVDRNGQKTWYEVPLRSATRLKP